MGAFAEGRPMVARAEIEAQVTSQGQLVYTDDTHMTIGVAESLVENRGFAGEQMAWTFIRNYKSEPWRGYGPGPPRVLRMIKSGDRWDKAAARLYGGGSFGNGSAMRIAPVGLFYRHDPNQLREIAYKSSMITHAHELGKEGAAVQAYAVALAANTPPGQELDRDSFLAKLENFARHPVYQKKIVR